MGLIDKLQQSKLAASSDQKYIDSRCKIPANKLLESALESGPDCIAKPNVIRQTYLSVLGPQPAAKYIDKFFRMPERSTMTERNVFIPDPQQDLLYASTDYMDEDYA